jgi:hypothetical protein
MQQQNALVSLLFLGLTIALMLWGVDLALMYAGMGMQARYRKLLRATRDFLRKQLSRFVRWAWREHKKFIVGFTAGVLATLYLTGYFQQ